MQKKWITLSALIATMTTTSAISMPNKKYYFVIGTSLGLQKAINSETFATGKYKPFSDLSEAIRTPLGGFIGFVKSEPNSLYFNVGLNLNFLPEEKVETEELGTQTVSKEFHITPEFKLGYSFGIVSPFIGLKNNFQIVHNSSGFEWHRHMYRPSLSIGFAFLFDKFYAELSMEGDLIAHEFLPGVPQTEARKIGIEFKAGFAF
jgi:hypothetical protein